MNGASRRPAAPQCSAMHVENSVQCCAALYVALRRNVFSAVPRRTVPCRIRVWKNLKLIGIIIAVTELTANCIYLCKYLRAATSKINSYLFLRSLQKFFVHVGTDVSAVTIVFHQFKNVVLKIIILHKLHFYKPQEIILVNAKQPITTIEPS